MSDVVGNADDPVAFDDLPLSAALLRGLAEAGFTRPSPIQARAIPLGRFGMDIIAQAKSGTGKTLVFALLALEMVVPAQPAPQVLIVAPTREIALQSRDVCKIVGSHVRGLVCHAFVGGTQMKADVARASSSHIACGTPGRLVGLLLCEALVASRVRLLVLDEADKLLDEGFEEQLRYLLTALPERKQTLAFSATYPPNLLSALKQSMNAPLMVSLLPRPGAHTDAQHHATGSGGDGGAARGCTRELAAESDPDAEQLVNTLNAAGFPSAFISGQHTQAERTSAMSRMRAFQLRVLVATDLLARGVDFGRVTLVLHIQLPRDLPTYLHRVGRAGRFATRGLSVMIAWEHELPLAQKMLAPLAITVTPLPLHLHQDAYLEPISVGATGTADGGSGGAATEDDSAPTAAAEPTGGGVRLGVHPGAADDELARLTQLLAVREAAKAGAPIPPPRAPPTASPASASRAAAAPAARTTDAPVVTEAAPAIPVARRVHASAAELERARARGRERALAQARERARLRHGLAPAAPACLSACTSAAEEQGAPWQQVWDASGLAGRAVTEYRI